MCFATAMTRKAKYLEEFYSVKKSEGERKLEGELTGYYLNGFTHPLMWIIPQERPEAITPALWGIMPPEKMGSDSKEYYKDAARFGAGLNARSEKLFEHFLYRNSADSRRCVIPVSGFFEPHTAPKKFKVPFYFEGVDSPLLSLAGIYAITKDKYVTLTILTKAATPLFEKIHNTKNRRPVILQRDRIKEWLSDGLTRGRVEGIIKNDMPDEGFNAFPVSKDIYSPKVDANRPDITDRVDYKELTWI